MNLLEKINKWGYKWDGRPNLPKTESINNRVFLMPEILRIEKSRAEGDRRWYGWLRGAWITLIALAINLPIFLIAGGKWNLLSLFVYLGMYNYAWYKGEIEKNTSGVFYHHRDADIRDFAVFLITTIALTLTWSL